MITPKAHGNVSLVGSVSVSFVAPAAGTFYVNVTDAGAAGGALEEQDAAGGAHFGLEGLLRGDEDLALVEGAVEDDGEAELLDFVGADVDALAVEADDLGAGMGDEDVDGGLVGAAEDVDLEEDDARAMGRHHAQQLVQRGRRIPRQARWK